MAKDKPKGKSHGLGGAPDGELRGRPKGTFLEPMDDGKGGTAFKTTTHFHPHPTVKRKAAMKGAYCPEPESQECAHGNYNDADQHMRQTYNIPEETAGDGDSEEDEDNGGEQ